MYATSGQWKFSKSSRKGKIQFENPTGPGEYSPQHFDTSRSFKLKGCYQDRQSDCEYDSSPCSYTLPDTKTKRGAIFKKNLSENMKENHDNGPSPFSYNPKSTTLKTGGYSLGRKL